MPPLIADASTVSGNLNCGYLSASVESAAPPRSTRTVSGCACPGHGWTTTSRPLTMHRWQGGYWVPPRPPSSPVSRREPSNALLPPTSKKLGCQHARRISPIGLENLQRCGLRGNPAAEDEGVLRWHIRL